MKNSQTKKMKSGVFKVLAANMFNLAINLVNGFLLPRLLPIATYADIKTFQLYLSFVGVISLGYFDGVYLEYGGKNFYNVTESKFSLCRTSMYISQTIAAVLLGGIAFYFDNLLFVFIALSIVPMNLLGTYKNIFLATGEFIQYSRVLNWISFLGLIVNISLVLVFKCSSYEKYVFYTIITFYVVWIKTELVLIHKYRKKFKLNFSLHDFFYNIKNGITLLLGNLSSIIMTSIDRWFVKFLLPTNDFAFYSFAVGVENVVVVFINAVTTTMYNYFCTNKDLKEFKKIKNVCGICSLFLISSAFGAKFIITYFITKYQSAVNIIFILFATKVFYMIIQGIYVNIYKSRKEQDKYFKQMLSIIVIGIILNTVFYICFKSKEGIAFATLVAVIIWYLLCEKSISEVRAKMSETFYIAINLSAFIYLGYAVNSILGFSVYICVVIVSSYIFVRDESLMIAYYIKDIYNKNKKRAFRKNRV